MSRLNPFKSLNNSLLKVKHNLSGSGSILLMAFLLSLFLVSCRHNQQKPVENEITKTQNPPFYGTAIVITGAAARIPQEAALLEKLNQYLSEIDK